MKHLSFALLSFLVVGALTGARAQQPATAAPQPSAEKMKVEDMKPKRADLLFLVKEAKWDSSTVKEVVQRFYQRLVSSALTGGADFQIFVGHDTIQVRLLTNTRDVTDWYSLLVRPGLLRIHLASDSLYQLAVDTAHVPAGNIVAFEPDMKTRRYVSERFLNGKLVQLALSVEQFDRPVLSGVIVPTDTTYRSFLFMKGMRIAALVDNVVYTSALVNTDSAAINQFPIATQYPPALTYILDRVIRYPLPPNAPVEFLGWRKVEEQK